MFFISGCGFGFGFREFTFFVLSGADCGTLIPADILSEINIPVIFGALALRATLRLGLGRELSCPLVIGLPQRALEKGLLGTWPGWLELVIRLVRCSLTGLEVFLQPLELLLGSDMSDQPFLDKLLAKEVVLVCQVFLFIKKQLPGLVNSTSHKPSKRVEATEVCHFPCELAEHNEAVIGCLRYVAQLDGLVACTASIVDGLPEVDHGASELPDGVMQLLCSNVQPLGLMQDISRDDFVQLIIKIWWEERRLVRQREPVQDDLLGIDSHPLGCVRVEVARLARRKGPHILV